MSKADKLIGNYHAFLQKEADKKLIPVIRAIEACEGCIDNRTQFYNCLLSQGMTFEQIAETEKITRQAVHKYLKANDL